MPIPLDQWATAGSGLVVVLAAIAAWIKWARPRVKQATADIVSGRDALLGRDEIRDSITGKVIAPALPGMGIRMDRNESQMTTLTEAVAQIAPALTQLAESHKRQEETDRVVARHDKQLALNTRQIEDNARAIADLKAAHMERIANHIESAAAWSAVGELAKNDHTEADK